MVKTATESLMKQPLQHSVVLKIADFGRTKEGQIGVHQKTQEGGLATSRVSRDEKCVGSCFISPPRIFLAVDGPRASVWVADRVPVFGCTIVKRAG